MATISSAGIGSGIDINGLVTSIVDAERAPAQSRLDLREATLQAELSGYGSLKSALSEFQGKLSMLGKLSTFQNGSGSSSNEEVLSVKAESTAAAGDYAVRIDQLAKSHSLASSGYASMNDQVGTGTIEFRFGTTDYVASPESYNSFTQNGATSTATVTIDSSNNTLEGVRDAINKADIGVNANIIFDGSQYRLTMTSAESGADYSMEVAISGDGDGNDSDTSGLSNLAFNGTATNLQQTVAAQDAQLVINGLAVTSHSNVVDEAIKGVTLELHKAQAAGDSDISVTIGRDNNIVENAVRNFVTGYNNLVSAVNDMTKYDPENKTAGILSGSSVTRSVLSGIRRIINDEITGLTGPYHSLADLGITTQRDGQLSVDAAKLSAAVASDPDAVAALFAETGSSDNTTRFRFISASTSTRVGSYPVEVGKAASHGAVSGSAAANLTISAGVNDTLDLNIDGTSASLVLPATTYASATDLAADLQSRINGLSQFRDSGISVTVSENAGVITIESASYGSASAVDVIGGNGRTDLLGGSGTPVAGADAEGSIGGLPAEGKGRVLSGTGYLQGMKIELQTDDTGPLGNVSYSYGMAASLSSLVSQVLSSKGSVSNRISGIKDRIDDVAERRDRLDERMTSLEERVRSQFIAMDQLVANLQSTGNYLTQQLAALPVIGAPKNRRNGN